MGHRLPAYSPEAEFNPEQCAVIAAPPGIVQVQAGAGTGKTKTLLGRIIGMACNERVEPERILGLVFNRGVQRHLSAALARRLGAHGEAVAVQTLNGFGHRVIRDNLRRLGYDPSRRVATVFEGEPRWRELLKIALRLDHDHAFPRDDAAWAATARRLERARIARALYESVPQEVGVAASHPLAAAFEDLLRRHNVVDGTAQAVLPLALFRRHHAVLAGYQSSLDLVLVDEAQDLSSVDFALVRLLVGRCQNLTAAGDVQQTLYSFRGALTRHMTEFPRHFGQRVERRVLRRSYRCPARVLEAVNAVAARLPYGERLDPEKGPGQPPFLIETADEAEEAAFVAYEIGRLADLGGLPPRAFAVIGRARSVLAPIAAALLAAGIDWGDAADERDAVRVDTIHAAKGGEWPIVFGVGLEDGILPARPALAAFEEGDVDAGRDELHALYVLMSRAQQRLYLSYCRRRGRGATAGRPALLSRFLAHPAILATLRDYDGGVLPESPLAGPLPAEDERPSGPTIDLAALDATIREEAQAVATAPGAAAPERRG